MNTQNFNDPSINYRIQNVEFKNGMKITTWIKKPGTDTGKNEKLIIHESIKTDQ